MRNGNHSIRKISLPENQESSGDLEFVDIKGEHRFVFTPKGMLNSTWLVSILLCWAGLVGILALTNISWLIWAILAATGVLFSGIMIAMVNTNHGARKTVLRIDKGVLHLERKNFLWTQIDAIPESEILAIQVALKSTDINQNLSRLKIWRVSAEPLELLHELDEPRLHWLEYELNQVLGRLPKEAHPTWMRALKDKQWPEPPTDSAIKIRANTPKRKSIMIPPLGMKYGWGVRLVGIGFLTIGLIVFLLNNPEPVIYLTTAFFGIAGLALTIGSFEYSFRWFEIEANHEQIEVNRHSLVGPKKTIWPVEMIKLIDLKNPEQQFEIRMLNIETKTRKSFQMMFGHAPNEILFVAAHLNELLPGKR